MTNLFIDDLLPTFTRRHNQKKNRLNDVFKHYLLILKCKGNEFLRNYVSQPN